MDQIASREEGQKMQIQKQTKQKITNRLKNRENRNVLQNQKPFSESEKTMQKPIKILFVLCNQKTLPERNLRQKSCKTPWKTWRFAKAQTVLRKRKTQQKPNKILGFCATKKTFADRNLNQNRGKRNEKRNVLQNHKSSHLTERPEKRNPD